MKKFLVFQIAILFIFTAVNAQKPISNSQQKPKGILYEDTPAVANNYTVYPNESCAVDSAACFEQQWVRKVGDKTFVLRLSEYPTQPWRNNLRVMDKTILKRSISEENNRPGVYFVDQFHRVGLSPSNPKIMFTNNSQSRLQFSYESGGKTYTIELEFGAED